MCVELSQDLTDELCHAVRFPRTNYVVDSLGLLQHGMHCFDIIASEPPVPSCLEIAQFQFFLVASYPPCSRSCDFARDHLRTPSRRLMIEENPTNNEQTPLA